MHVHPAAVDAVQRLGHERRVQAVVGGDLLDDEPADHDAVGHDQGLGVVRVDLVLRRGDLVVRGFHGDVEPVEDAHRLLAQVVAEVGGQDVEVAALVGELGAFPVLEVEVLEFGADVELEAHVGGPLELAAQDPAWVALVRPIVAVEDVAEDERRPFVALGPGHHLEGRPVGHRDDVRFLDLGVTGDRRAVEGGAALEDGVKLAVGDLDHLEVPEDVREPQLDVLHVLVGDAGADRGLELFVHGHPFRPGVRVGAGAAGAGPVAMPTFYQQGADGATPCGRRGGNIPCRAAAAVCI